MSGWITEMMLIAVSKATDADGKALCLPKPVDPDPVATCQALAAGQPAPPQRYTATVKANDQCPITGQPADLIEWEAWGDHYRVWARRDGTSYGEKVT